MDLDADGLIAVLPQSSHYPPSAQEKLESHNFLKLVIQLFNASYEEIDMSLVIRNTLNKIGRTAISSRCIPLLLLTMMMMCSLPAYAEYTYQVVNPPGADLMFFEGPDGLHVEMTEPIPSL